MEKAIGIDIGSQKTIIVCDDGERILTSTGIAVARIITVISVSYRWNDKTNNCLVW